MIENIAKYFKGKKVFLTGHTGFKGSWLLSWLHLLGADVKGYALALENDIDLYNQIKEQFEIDEQPCEHVWVINNHIMSNGALCNKCFTTSIHIPDELK